tara:strand:- start:627 stop:2006 length:1380 start_codon:yes stop_codon:yes gene_type:complete
MFRHPETDVLYWRRTDPVTKKRVSRSTGTDVLEDALKVAQDFQDEWRKKKAGIETFSEWKKPLLPLVEEFLQHQRHQEGAPGEGWLEQKRSMLTRAFEILRVSTTGDLTDLAALDRTMRDLDLPAATKRRRLQDPLRQFSAWLAGNQRHLDRNPLTAWEVISYTPKEIHRALMPEEFARALVASEWLDVIHRREHSTRIIYTLLLVSMPRVSALTSRSVEHYSREGRRIHFGSGRGKKLRGQGKLDVATARELELYLGSRREGPLLLSPRGSQIQPRNLLSWWKESFGLGLVWELWPAEEPWSIDRAYLVNSALHTGRVSLRLGGNPNLIKRKTKRARLKRLAEIEVIADELRSPWVERMDRVTLHCLRHTHETWALSCGVEQVLINLQGGWQASRTREDCAVKRVQASMTGMNRYLDVDSDLLKVRKSPEAIRRLLDEALERVNPGEMASESATDESE